jgi:ELWxxDGT repeat protein
MKNILHALFGRILPLLLCASSAISQVEIKQIFSEAVVPENPVVVKGGGKIFFLMEDDIGNAINTRIWAINAAGAAVLVATNSTRITRIFNIGEKVFYLSFVFGLDNNTFLYTLYELDPATLASTPVKEFCCGRVYRYQAWGDKMLLIENEVGGKDILWVSDGSSDGTRVLAVLDGFLRKAATLDNGRVLFWEHEGDIQRIWSSDGGTNPPDLLAVFEDSSNAQNLISMGDYALYSTANALGRSDGTAAGTTLFADFTALGLRNVDFAKSQRIGNQLLFAAYDTDGWAQMWHSDGSTGGTQRLVAPLNDPDWFEPKFFFSLEGQHYCIANVIRGTDAVLELWRSDGSPGGTQLLQNLAETLGMAFVSSVRTHGKHALIMAYSQTRGYEPLLFRDGNFQPTDLWSGNGSSSRGFFLRSAFPVGDFFFLSAERPGAGQELHRIDARSGESSLVADNTPGVKWSLDLALDTIGPWLYFLNSPSFSRGDVQLCRVRYDAPLPNEVEIAQPPYQWAQGIGSLNTPDGNIDAVYSESVCASADGSVFASGSYRGETGLGFLNSDFFLGEGPGFQNGFFSKYIARMGPDGQGQWAQWIGGGGQQERLPLAPTPENGVYIAGTYINEGFFGGERYETTEQRMYLARLDSGGALEWLAQANIGASGKVLQVISDAAGNVWAAGMYSNFSAQFGDTLLRSEVNPAYFIARYTPDGLLEWVKSYDVPAEWAYFGDALDMALGPKGRLYLTIGNAWHNTSISCAFAPRPSYVRVVCLEPNGELEWEREFKSTNLTYPTGIAVTPAGIVYVAGIFQGSFEGVNAPCGEPTGFLLTLNEHGRPLRKPFENTNRHAFYDLSTDAEGNIYCSGLGRQLINQSYPGYGWPFPQGGVTSFVQVFDGRMNLLAERHFFKIGYNWYDHLPQLALLPGGDLLLSDRYETRVDTLADLPYSIGTSAMFLRFNLPLKPLVSAPNETLLPAAIQLRPNPVTSGDFLFVYSDDGDFQTETAQVLDLLGRPMDVALYRLDGQTCYIDVRRLRPGAYVLSVRMGNKWVGQRFVRL